MLVIPLYKIDVMNIKTVGILWTLWALIVPKFHIQSATDGLDIGYQTTAKD